jgi:hypothetical protein
MVSPPVRDRSDRQNGSKETITLRATETGQTMDVVVLSKRADRIHVMLGEGTHSVFCELKPTRDACAYVGNAMGREMVYDRSRAQVEADIDRRGPLLGDSSS